MVVDYDSNFFPFLRIVESDNSPFKQKMLVVEALQTLCADPKILTQIFLNYDCDFDAANLYKNILLNITRLCSKTHGLIGSTKKSQQEDSQLSNAGLEVLVALK